MPHPDSGWGPGQNRNLGAPFTKIILVNIVLDNNIFIRFFTGECEDNYLHEDMGVLPWLSVHWINEQRGFDKSRESYSVTWFSFET